MSKGAARKPGGVRVAQEAELQVRGACMAYRQWGSDSEYPVLALHGWLDNAASFDALGPLLAGYRILAVDLPGHGLSAHRAQSGSYNIWDDLPDLIAFTHALGLQRYALLGHSRGAFIATLLAAIEGTAVSSLTLLDGISPPPLLEHQTVAQLRKFAHDYGRRVSREARVFASVDDAVQARVSATGIDPRAAHMLVPRSVRSVPGGVCWATDGRLRYASALKFGSAHLNDVMGSLDLPGLLVLAASDVGRRSASSAAVTAFAGLRVEHVDGCHHCHMLDQASDVATRISTFWRSCEQTL